MIYFPLILHKKIDLFGYSPGSVAAYIFLFDIFTGRLSYLITKMKAGFCCTYSRAGLVRTDTLVDIICNIMLRVSHLIYRCKTASVFATVGSDKGMYNPFVMY